MDMRLETRLAENVAGEARDAQSLQHRVRHDQDCRTPAGQGLGLCG
jgi:hypothetical protein